jgi:hypothetical protein
MTERENLDKIRGAALDRIERSQRNYRLAFYGAVLIETLFLGGFVMLADFNNRLHLLLLLATIAVYSILGLGLLALGSHVSRNTQIILKAIELIEERSAGKMDRQS